MLHNLNRLSFLFSISIILALLIERYIVILTFGDGQIYSSSELFDVFLMSLRFDLKLVATILLAVVYLPAFLLIKFPNNILYSLIKASLFIVFLLIALLSFTEYGYYLFFGNGIDILIFGIIDDGTNEVVSSILGDNRLVKILFTYVLFIVIFIFLLIRSPRETIVQNKAWSEYIKLIVIILICFILARGSLSTFPLSRKVANATDNSFLNSLSFGPLWNLYYANHDRLENDFKLTTKDILKQAHVNSFQKLKEAAGYNDTCKLITKTNKNDFLKKNPPHVIFIQQEGWSTHIGLSNSKENNIYGEFARHAKEDYLYESFFSNAYGTSPTLNNLLLNSPISGLSQSKASKISFSTSSVLPFKENGYSITFLSGGSSAWRNHNIFWPRQGFDKYIGRKTIEDYYNYICDNPWGVYEEYTFKYLQKILIENIESGKPSFTYVLTTNNHGPIKLPPNFKKPKFNMEKLGFSSKDKQHYTQLMGYYYQTNAFGKFLTWLKSSKYKDDVIIAATGDHILKGYDNYNSPTKKYLKYAVLTYFYLPKKYDKLTKIPKNIVGSHNDIFPTLYELSLSDTNYYNFGQAIMNKNDDNAFGWQESETFLFSKGVVSKDMKLAPWDLKTKKRSLLLKNKKNISQYMKEVIIDTKKQILLKKYILLNEYETKK